MSLTPEQKKLTDCFWFLKNECVKGQACEYRHSKAAQENPTVCKFWVEGKCTNQNCIFRHPSGVQPKDKSQTVCYFFTHGGCMKGASCPFSHAAPEESELNELDKIKQQQEAELRKLQELRKQEEERLARLRAETERIAQASSSPQKDPSSTEYNEKRKQFQEKKRKELAAAKSKQPKKKQELSGGVASKQLPLKKDKTGAGDKSEKQNKSQKPTGFVKSFSEILKEKKEAEAAQQKQTEQNSKRQRDGGKKAAQRATKVQKKEPEPVNSGPVSFGVKSLEEILKEKEKEKEKEEKKPAAQSKQESKPAPSTTAATSLTSNKVEELKKKNAQKFNASATSSPQTPKVMISKVIEEPAQPVQSPSSSKKGSRMDDIELSLEEELDNELNSYDSSEAVNIDDFDKEVSELESLIKG